MEARRRRPNRPASALLGAVLVLAGIPMLVCPGPGIASILGGIGLLLYAVTGRTGEDAAAGHSPKMPPPP